MNIKSQFALSCISRAIDAAEEVLPLFEKKYPKDDRPRRVIDLAKQWFSLMQQGREAQAKQMGGQLRNAADAAHAAAGAAAAHAAADAAAHAAANVVYAAYANYAIIAAASIPDVTSAASAVAFSKEARGGDWFKAKKAEIQWQDKEAARLIESNKGEILWGENAAIFLIGKMNLRLRRNNIQMIEARKVLS